MKIKNQTYFILGISMLIIGAAFGFMADNPFGGLGFAGVGIVFLVMGLGSEKNVEPKRKDLT